MLHRGFRTHYNVERNRARLYPCLYPSLRMGRVKSAAEARMGASAIDDGSSEIVLGVQSIGCDFRFTTIDVEGISRISTAKTIRIPKDDCFNLIGSFMNVLGSETTNPILIQYTIPNYIRNSVSGLATHCCVQSSSQGECQSIWEDTLPKHSTVGETVNITMCGNLAYKKVHDSPASFCQLLGLMVILSSSRVRYLEAEVVQKLGLPALG
ncbi:hypothetical protein C8R41DRAFT_863150 [Lentinula lateritia]|uniref:Uncharacterized protein n=1 Tax=Lentinula lateritia TaxID=40482 RepID=A0ABQ8VW11_9AGAR|nr:hypothetical protein C8R41DRAFT_863150 [Lentinula lateritia]